MYIISLMIKNGVKVYLSKIYVKFDYKFVINFQCSDADQFVNRDDALKFLDELSDDVRSLNWQIEKV